MTRYFSRLPCLETVEAANDAAGEFTPVLHACRAGIVGLAELEAAAAEAAELEARARELVWECMRAVEARP